MPPKHTTDKETDEVPPKDAIDAKARHIEEGMDHARGGHQKTANEHQVKPHSSRAN